MSDQFEQLKARLARPSDAAAVGRHSHPVGGARTVRREPRGWREAAVQILLADTATPDVTFIERATHLRKHAGQIAFPGGSREPGDASLIHTAQRETAEEIGLNTDRTEVLGVLSAASVPASGFDVTTVVSRWDGDADLRPTDLGEVAAVHRFALSDLASASYRVTARHSSGYVGPGFVFGDIFIWGFTGHLTSVLLDLGGWTRPWRQDTVVDVPRRFQRDENQGSAD